MPDKARKEILKPLDIEEISPGAFDGEWFGSGEPLGVISPIDGKPIATVTQASEEDYERVAAAAYDAFLEWRAIPAPKRGEIVRLIGNALREKKELLGKLVTLEMGKILAEGEGEVQEMIDVCDFAVGLSRQLYGLTLKSERPDHRMMEQWHPLGPIGVISAFNFPVAVWAWNFAVAAVCGDATIWKPSSKVPLTAIASTKIAAEVLKENGVPGAVASLVIGRGKDVGERLINDPRVRLVSFTGSTVMGKRVGEVVGARLGKTILELGGNNAVIVSDRCNITNALQTVLFGAVGTAGQRCTSTRRVIIQEKAFEEFVGKLVGTYQQVKIGNPLDDGVLVGPVIDTACVEAYFAAIEACKKEGGELLYGGAAYADAPFDSGTYVVPTIMEAENRYDIVQRETFAPILYVMPYSTIEEAVALHNGVPQGLSSAIFTDDVYEAEYFVSDRGSDCGIANVNIGTSGAEIGGAFGGEKETGGGRESGSDSWKQYMFRQTNTISWAKEIHLAQGIKFEL
ncbi:MAG: aldehyde dehydrogenase family protein [Candidatus Coatesbacteria bacterium]|nr:MAG: aldehyde dehydrogenase family protein [Candidatus Coatesbacteria bacterium]